MSFNLRNRSFLKLDDFTPQKIAFLTAPFSRVESLVRSIRYIQGYEQMVTWGESAHGSFLHHPEE